MRRFVRQVQRRVAKALGRRSYEGAGGGRRWGNAPAAFPSNAHALAGASAIRGRARYLCGNNPYAKKALSTLVSAIIGTGVKPQTTLEDTILRATFNRAFERWTDRADADEVGDFYALSASMVAAMIRDGEALAIMETDDRDGALRLRQIAAEQLDAAQTRELSDGGRIVAGVEFDRVGRRVAYWIFPMLKTFHSWLRLLRSVFLRLT